MGGITTTFNVTNMSVTIRLTTKKGTKTAKFTRNVAPNLSAMQVGSKTCTGMVLGFRNGLAPVSSVNNFKLVLWARCSTNLCSGRVFPLSVLRTDTPLLSNGRHVLIQTPLTIGDTTKKAKNSVSFSNIRPGGVEGAFSVPCNKLKITTTWAKSATTSKTVGTNANEATNISARIGSD